MKQFTAQDTLSRWWLPTAIAIGMVPSALVIFSGQSGRYSAHFLSGGLIVLALLAWQASRNLAKRIILTDDSIHVLFHNGHEITVDRKDIGEVRVWGWGKAKWVWVGASGGRDFRFTSEVSDYETLISLLGHSSRTHHNGVDWKRGQIRGLRSALVALAIATSLVTAFMLKLLRQAESASTIDIVVLLIGGLFCLAGGAVVCFLWGFQKGIEKQDEVNDT